MTHEYVCHRPADPVAGASERVARVVHDAGELRHREGGRRCDNRYERAVAKKKVLPDDSRTSSASAAPCRVHPTRTIDIEHHRT